MLDTAQLFVEATAGTVAYVKHRIRVLLAASLIVLVLGQLLGMAGITAFSWMQTHTVPSPETWLPMAGLAAPIPILATVLWVSLGLTRLLCGLPVQAMRTMIVTATERQQRRQEQHAATGALRGHRIELAPQPELPQLPYPLQPYLLPPDVDDMHTRSPRDPSYSLPNALLSPELLSPDWYSQLPARQSRGYPGAPLHSPDFTTIPPSVPPRGQTGQPGYGQRAQSAQMGEISAQPTLKLRLV